jgi:hypothetical protein
MNWFPNAEEAALIATAVTLIGILITNQAKVSEFRQLWINALRDDAATLISHTLIVHAARAGENIDESYLQIHQATARIRLRLNPDESKAKKIIAAMNNMRDANHAETEFSVMNQCVDEFTKAVQNVLRSEWRRVKWGEPLYRIIFFLVAVGMLLSFTVILHKSYPSIFHFISGSH